MKFTIYIFFQLLIHCSIIDGLGPYGNLFKNAMNAKNFRLNLENLAKDLTKEIDETTIFLEKHITAKKYEPVDLPQFDTEGVDNVDEVIKGQNRKQMLTITSALCSGISTARRKGNVKVTYKSSVFDVAIPIMFEMIEGTVWYKLKSSQDKPLGGSIAEENIEMMLNVKVGYDKKNLTYTLNEGKQFRKLVINPQIVLKSTVHFAWSFIAEKVLKDFDAAIKKNLGF